MHSSTRRPRMWTGCHRSPMSQRLSDAAPTQPAAEPGAFGRAPSAAGEVRRLRAAAFQTLLDMDTVSLSFPEGSRCFGGI